MSKRTSAVAFLSLASLASGYFNARPAILPAPFAAVSTRTPAPIAMSAGNEEMWSDDDDHALQDFIKMKEASAAQCGRPERVLRNVDSAWVLIFNVGQADEGVYTLQGRATRAAAYVLAFEQTDDAQRFAQLLEGEGFDLATPLCWDTEQLCAFCDAGEFEVSLVPQVRAPREREMHTAPHTLDAGTLSRLSILCLTALSLCIAIAGRADHPARQERVRPRRLRPRQRDGLDGSVRDDWRRGDDGRRPAGCVRVAALDV